jgi:hypothetical protein
MTLPPTDLTRTVNNKQLGAGHGFSVMKVEGGKPEKPWSVPGFYWDSEHA